MAITRVQASTGGVTGTGTSLSLAFPSDNTAGNLLVATVQSQGDPTSVSDSRNTWSSAAAGTQNNGTYAETFYTANCGAGANTVQANFGASIKACLQIAEYSGVATSSPLDGTPTNNSGFGTSMTTGAITTTVADAVIIVNAACENGVGSPLTHGGSFNEVDETVPGGSQPGGGHMQERIVTSTGSYSGAGTLASTTNWVMHAAAFKGVVAVFEQEGFRFRADDGDEDGATWLAAQDANITRDVGQNTRLRVLVDTALADPASTTLRLDFKESTDSVYVAVPLAQPALSRAQLDAGASTSNVQTFDTASVTLTAGRLYILAFTHSDAASEQAATSVASVSGGISFASLDSQTYDTVATNAHRLSLWWVIPGSTVTSAVRITLNDAGTGCAWNLQEYTNPLSPNPFGTPAKSGVDAASAVSATPGTLAATSSHQIAFGAHDLNSTSDVASGTNWSSVGTGNAYATPNTGLECAENTSGTASQVTFSTAGTADRAVIAVEVKCAAPSPILMSASANIAASGEATTAQLTAPSSGSFTAGRMQDDENPADAVDIGNDGYTEMEWCLTAVSGVAVNGDIYQFRVRRNGGTALDTYTVTPEWTIGSGGTIYDDTGAGGVTVGGTGDAIATYNQLGSGGSIAGGAGSAQGTYTLDGSGSVALDGSGDAVRLQSVAGSGEVALAGAGVVVGTFTQLGTGAATITSSGDVQGTYAQLGSDTATIGGNGAVTSALHIIGAGSATLGGLADVQASYTIAGAGTATLAGAGDNGSGSTFNDTGSGGAVIAGVGEVQAVLSIAAGGGVTLDGGGAASCVYAIGSSAGAQVSGAGAAQALYAETGIGGVLISGEGTVVVGVPILKFPGSGDFTRSGMTGVFTDEFVRA